MSRATVRIALIAAGVTIAALAVGAVAFVYSGAYNVAATRDHTAAVQWALNTMQERSVAVRAGEVPAPPALDSALVAQGFEHFREMCVVCHGAPGVERGEFGRGITPTPPSLSERARAFGTRDLFWIVKHGIKLAGMPAFGVTHSDEEIWGIVGFVERLPEMTPEMYATWEAGYGGGADDASGSGHTHAPSPASR